MDVNALDMIDHRNQKKIQENGGDAVKENSNNVLLQMGAE